MLRDLPPLKTMKPAAFAVDRLVVYNVTVQYNRQSVSLFGELRADTRAVPCRAVPSCRCTRYKKKHTAPAKLEEVWHEEKSEALAELNPRPNLSRKTRLNRSSPPLPLDATDAPGPRAVQFARWSGRMSHRHSLADSAPDWLHSY